MPSSLEEEASLVLWQCGTLGIEVRPQSPAEATLVSYFADRAGLEATLHQALAAIPHRIQRLPVPEVDWVERFRAGFRPFELGAFLVAPAWDLPPLSPRQHLLVVDPGRAFGTGTHESTRLCLRVLESLAARRALGRLLDVGTGSGILAVAGCRLGATPVIAVDTDAEAAAAALAHARLNGVRLHVLVGDAARALRRASFDLVLANLTAPLLLERRDELRAACRPGGTLVLSGFLSEDAPELQAAYAFPSSRCLHEGEWAALLLEGT